MSETVAVFRELPRDSAVIDLARVQHFIDSSRQSSSQDELQEFIRQIREELGFAHFWLVQRVEVRNGDGDAEQQTASKVVALSDYPEEWVQAYVIGNLAAKDPVLRASHHAGVGFSWSEIPDMVDLAPEQNELFELGRQAGIVGGFTVPARARGLTSGSCNFAIGAGRPVPPANLLLAELVGIHALDASRRIAQSNHSQLCRRTLTRRQRDCIELVGRGKTDWEIAQILGISPATVKEHIDDARRKYGVSKRVQIVLRAAFEGQIQLSSVIH
jgi:LuxR family quorum-sensing system transcriptional regulator CciR